MPRAMCMVSCEQRVEALVMGEVAGHFAPQRRESAPRDALELVERAVQLGVGARRHPEFERGVEEGTAEGVRHEVEQRVESIGAVRVRHGFGPPAQFRRAARGQMRDGRDDEVLLAREVVHLRAARDAGALADRGGGGARVADLDQRGDRRVEQPCARLGAALFLGAPRSRVAHREGGGGAGGLRHRDPHASREKQTVKTDCKFTVQNNPTTQ